MARKRKPPVPTLEVPPNATLRQIYTIYRKTFSAADLQKYTKIEPTVPMAKVLADMEKVLEQENRKRKK
ncbi:MAG: hypothetical protein FJ271_14845 [Planctomycetes bacterium]|nr:hypothetical protein [Planctomycetota bacterium]